MQIKDRIKELRRVPASQLQSHPLNWRTHPEEQRKALGDLIDRIGFAGATLVRELPDGSLQLIGGRSDSRPRDRSQRSGSRSPARNL